MKKTFRLTTVLLVALMILSLVGCGGNSSGSYTVENIKPKLAEFMNIDESEINVTDRSGTVVMSYGSDGISVDAYVFKNAKAAQDYFSIPAMAAAFNNKTVDEADHKIWTSKIDGGGIIDDFHSIIALKGNFIILYLGGEKPDSVISHFDLD